MKKYYLPAFIILLTVLAVYSVPDPASPGVDLAYEDSVLLKGSHFELDERGKRSFGQGCRKNIPLSFAWATIASPVSSIARDFLVSQLGGITKAQRSRGEELIVELNKIMAETEPSQYPFVNCE